MLRGCSCVQARQTNERDEFLSGAPLFDVAGITSRSSGSSPSSALFAAGLVVAECSSKRDRSAGFFGRFKLDANFIAIVTTILSAGRLRFLHRQRRQRCRHSAAWNAPLPGVALSLLQIFFSSRCSSLVFWISSRTKRFLFNRFLVNSGLDRSLQYAIAQIVSNLVLVVGVFIVLENTGIHLGALTVFAGAVGVGVGFGLQNIASNFISGLVILAERPITIGDRVEVAGITGQVQQIRARSTVW